MAKSAGGWSKVGTHWPVLWTFYPHFDFCERLGVRQDREQAPNQLNLTCYGSCPRPVLPAAHHEVEVKLHPPSQAGSSGFSHYNLHFRDFHGISSPSGIGKSQRFLQCCHGCHFYRQGTRRSQCLCCCLTQPWVSWVLCMSAPVPQFRSSPERKRGGGVALAWPFLASLPTGLAVDKATSKCQQRVIPDVSAVLSTDTVPLYPYLILRCVSMDALGRFGDATDDAAAHCALSLPPIRAKSEPHSSPNDRAAAGRSSSLVVRDRPTPTCCCASS